MNPDKIPSIRINADPVAASCPLCSGVSQIFHERRSNTWHLCNICRGIFADKSNLPQPQAEEERYSCHNNDVNDKGYQDFVMPLVKKVLASFTPNHEGLDFGAGPGPVISHLLQKQGFQPLLYDPFFHNHPQLLRQKYDYIICCEVMEHFHHPAREFALLKSILRENGKLFCMTGIYHPSIDFASWHYMNDFTHVFFYQRETLEFIREKFNFSGLEIEGNVIVFSV